MLEVMLECKNVVSDKIANCLAKFGKSFHFKYSIWVHNNCVYSIFRVNSVSTLNELTRRLKHIKGIDFSYLRIEKVDE